MANRCARSLAYLLCTGIAVAAVGLNGRSATPTTRIKQPAAQIYAGACDATDVLQVLGKGGLAQKPSPPHADVLFVWGRIATCKSIIYRYIATQAPAGRIIAHSAPGLPPLPPPQPSTTPPPGCSVSEPGTKKPSYDLLGLYSALTFCNKWIAANIPSASPTPQPVGFHSPYPGSLDPWTKPIYVLALASDAPTSAQLSLQLANDLRSPKMHPEVEVGYTPSPSPDIYSDRADRFVVIAAPTWTLSQYQQQCFNDPSTAGAVVAVQPGTQSSSWNFALQASWTALSVQLMVLDCEPTNSAYVNNAAYITYVSHVRTRTGRRYSFNLSTALGLLGGYLALQSNTTKTFTAATPPAPPYNKFAESQYTISNIQGTGAGAAVAVAGLSPLSAIGQGNNNIDAQTAGAIAPVLLVLIDDLMWTCTKPLPGGTSFPEPQCRWFSYRPPAPPQP